MDNKSLRLHKIILAIEIGIASLIIVLKLVYYISKFQDGFFESVLDFVIWTTVSVFISLIPISILVILNESEIRKKKVHPKYILVFVGYIICLTININFEVCSYMMACVGFSGKWARIAFSMLGCHFISIIPFCMTVYLYHNSKKQEIKNV